MLADLFGDGRLQLDNCTYPQIVIAEGAQFSEATHAMLVYVDLAGVFRAAPANPAAASRELMTETVTWQICGNVVNTFVIEAQSVDGDPHVVSRAQYEYIKNFADRPGAPEETRIVAWHFKPLGLGALNS